MSMSSPVVSSEVIVTPADTAVPTTPEDEFPVITEKIQENWVGILYGESGVGKSSLAMQIPNSIMFDIERGCGGIYGPKQRFPTNKHPTYILNAIRQCVHKRIVDGYTTIIFDSLYVIQDLFEKQYLLETGKEALTSANRGNDYTIVCNRFKKWLGSKDEGMIAYILSKGCNLLILGHEDRYEAEFDGKAMQMVQLDAYKGIRRFTASLNVDFVFYYLRNIDSHTEQSGHTTLKTHKTNGRKIYTDTMGNIFAKNKYQLKPVYYDPKGEWFTDIRNFGNLPEQK